MSYKSDSRRNFIKRLGQFALSMGIFIPVAHVLSSEITALGPRVRKPNPFISTDGKPILVCVEGDNFDQMLSTGLDAMGGLSKLIGDNENVLIKPNCVTSEVYPTTSDVNSLVSTIEQLQAV
ncbi:MAG: hypothetical protein GF315_00315, partial [candidate division Zixibacteria bacterium]|nr:hypothetical protein [candidate division Zixibacteria bacterium]